MIFKYFNHLFLITCYTVTNFQWCNTLCAVFSFRPCFEISGITNFTGLHQFFYSVWSSVVVCYSRARWFWILLHCIVLKLFDLIYLADFFLSVPFLHVSCFLSLNLLLEICLSLRLGIHLVYDTSVLHICLQPDKDYQIVSVLLWYSFFLLI